MFTGIIEDKGNIKQISILGDDREFIIKTNISLHNSKIGCSIACDGVCLTVTKIVIKGGYSLFSVMVSKHSLACTILNNWKKDTKINLEKSLTVGEELGGHIVTGHIDNIAKVVLIQKIEQSYRYHFQLPMEYMPLVVEKASIAIQGVALTINNIGSNFIEVNIIPHTYVSTNICDLIVGSYVNFEIDILARYVQRILSYTKDVKDK